MLVRGLGVVGAGIVPAPTTEQSIQYAGGSLPWQCGWVPFYAQFHPEMCAELPAPPVPVAPVVPGGALDPNQGPATSGPVDQVILDTAAAQRAQTQDFFSMLAANLGLQDPGTCAPDAFWCRWGGLILLSGIGFILLVAMNQAKGLVSR